MFVDLTFGKVAGFFVLEKTELCLSILFNILFVYFINFIVSMTESLISSSLTLRYKLIQ